jgi:hypothetical protein
MRDQVARHAMQIFPRNRQDWLKTVLFPFKAYTIVAPLMLMVSAYFPHPQHFGATDTETFCGLLLFPCSLVLFSAALILAFVGPRGSAFSCAGFGVIAFIIGFLFSPCLARA